MIVNINGWSHWKFLWQFMGMANQPSPLRPKMSKVLRASSNSWDWVMTFFRSLHERIQQRAFTKSLWQQPLVIQQLSSQPALFKTTRNLWFLGEQMMWFLSRPQWIGFKKNMNRNDRNMSFLNGQRWWTVYLQPRLRHCGWIWLNMVEYTSHPKFLMPCTWWHFGMPGNALPRKTKRPQSFRTPNFSDTLGPPVIRTCKWLVLDMTPWAMGHRTLFLPESPEPNRWAPTAFGFRCEN